MTNDLPPSAARVQQALLAHGSPFRVVQMPSSTRTAQEAAAAIGCAIAQIAKSILFKGAVTGKPVLVVASGTNRVDEQLVAERSGEPLAKATADFVREATGYVIGGVAPVGFPQPIETWIDADLLQFTEVWAAAGTPFAVFSLDPQAIAGLTGGRVSRVSRSGP
jgi:prolyl-tRNA editing enzyme YbaK/EbsC (Cys-tRNA(Pro) deacylase)